MKRRIVLILSFMLIGMLLTGVAGYALGQHEVVAKLVGHVKVTKDGNSVNLGADVPLNYQGKTYLPVRAVGEALGFNVDWDANSSTVSFTSPEGSVQPKPTPPSPPESPQGKHKVSTISGVEVIDLTVVPKLDFRWTSFNKIDMKYEATVLVNQTKGFDEAPIATIEVINSNGTVVASNTRTMKKAAGKYDITITSRAVEFPISLTDEEAIEKLNSEYYVHIKIN